MGPILIDLNSACFGAEIMRSSIVLGAWQIWLQYLHGSSPVVCCKSSLWLSRGYQKVPDTLLLLRTGEDSCLFVEVVIHKIRLILWCLIWLIIVIGCEGNPGGASQIAEGKWNSLCFCSQRCHHSSSPFATGNSPRRCSTG